VQANVIARKRALVVDDSKSARVILSRMLEKYDIEVDMADSAEAAIEYLKHDRPDAIFMDHQMPGMDGLQAVKVIKSDPLTAMIPIMMYTSQAGELYVGQARALGAMGVLPKQVRPVDVSKVLYELHLLPDRRGNEESALVPVELEGGAPVERAPPSPAGGPDSFGPRIESAIKQQSVDLRRFIVASLDSFAARLTADLRHVTPAAAAPLSFAPPEPPAAPRRAALGPWPIAAALLAVFALLGVLGWLGAREDLAKVRSEIATLRSANGELMRSRDQLAGSVKDLAAALAAGSSAPSAAAPGAAAATGLPRAELVPYGEVPFDRSRTEALREVLAKLEAQGFRGVLKVTSASGVFCLSGNAGEGFAPASPSLLASKCDLVGNPFDESLVGQSRESLSFANVVAGVRQRSGGAIAVTLENAGGARPGTPYPPRSESLTAGEWNRAAQANNRVDFTAEPAP
jgi:CheY-like chemotaxis protein